MKFLLKPVLALAALVMVTSGAKAQDTLRVTLKEAIQIALSDNPTIKVADQEIELKKEANREVLYGLLPEVSLVGSFNHTIEKQSFAMMGQVMRVGTLNNASGGVTASLPVFVPALYQSMKLTKTDVQLALEKARSSRLDMVNQVTKAFYQLLLAQDSYEVLQKSYKQSEDNFNVVNAKYEQGSVSEYDKISADVQMRSLKPTLVSAGNGVNLAMLQLKVLLGMESEMPVAVVGNLKDYEMAMFTRQAQPQPADIVGGNTTLRQLELNKDMLQRNLKLKYTNFMPSLELSFQYMYTSMSENWRIADYKWNPYSTLGLSLSIPLFKGGNFSQVKQAKLQLKQLDQTRINTERQLKMQAQSYLDNMAASTEQVVSNKEAVLQAEKGRTIAEKRYEVGRGTILELNSSEVALTQAKLTYNQSIYDYLVAKANLDLVMGVEDVINVEEEKKAETTAAETVIEKPTVKLATVTSRDVEQIGEFTATVEAEAKNNIAPTAPGRISQIFVEVGDYVRKGQKLVQMDAANLTQLKLQLDNQETEFKRVDELYKVGGASKAEWDAAKTNLDVRKSAYNNLLENTQLVSPLNGVVTARNFDNGDLYTSTQMPVLVVEQIAPVKLMVNVSEPNFPKVSKGMPVTVKLDVYEGEAFEGKVSLVYPTIDAATHTFPVEITLANANQRVRPGMFARVTMNFGTKNHVVVPDMAIVKRAGSGDRYVYVYNNGKVSYNKVELGRRIGTEYELISGVDNNSQVVIAGQTRLADGVEVEVIQ